MTKVRTYQELIAWQKAMDLVVAIYDVTRAFPKDEMYGLTNQLRRAAVAIPSNIAEGQGRQSPKEFRHFLSVAYGSLQEAETQLLIALRLQYISAEQADILQAQCSEVGRLLNGLSRSLSIG